MRGLIPLSHNTEKAQVSYCSGQFCYFIVISKLATRERKTKHLTKNGKNSTPDRTSVRKWDVYYSCLISYANAEITRGKQLKAIFPYSCGCLGI